jgi:hypothetical protein
MRSNAFGVLLMLGFALSQIRPYVRPTLLTRI